MSPGTPAPAARSADATLPELTSLRFVAAFAVLVLHYRDLLGPLPPWLLKGIVGGQYGVTFFFVLSGFILTYRYRDWFAAGVRDAAYWRFQRFRIARLYPVYVLGLLLDTPWHLAERAQAGQLASVGTTWWASWLLNLVGLQAWVPAVPFAMFWNTPAWSVSAEFFFYATFPFVTAFLARRGSGPWRWAAWIGLAVAASVALYAAVVTLLVDVVRAGAEAQYIVLVYNPLLRFAEFLCGCLAGQWFLREPGLRAWLGAAGDAARQRRDAIVLLCLVAVCVRVWMPDYAGPSRGWWLVDVSIKYAVFIVPFAALVLAVASGRTFLSPLLGRPWMVLLGEASYALYIVHWSATTFLRLGWLGQPAPPLVGAAFLLLTVAASVAVYRWVEVPWRRRLRGGGADGGDAKVGPAARPAEA